MFDEITSRQKPRARETFISCQKKKGRRGGALGALEANQTMSTTKAARSEGGRVFCIGEKKELGERGTLPAQFFSRVNLATAGESGRAKSPETAGVNRS